MPAAQVATHSDKAREAGITRMLTQPWDPEPAAETDPIFAAIEKDRALAAEHIRLLGICGDKPDADPSWEETRAAGNAQWDHWRDVLLKTVPQTAAGCAALAGYVAEWEAREGVDLDEAAPAIFDLIARSPMLPAIGAGTTAPDPIFALIEAHDVVREAFSAVCDAADKAQVGRQGGDTSDEAMAPARAAWEAANLRDIEAWNALFMARPTSFFGLLALIRHAQKWAADQEGLNGAINLAGVFEAIGDGLRVVAWSNADCAAHPDADLIALGQEFDAASAAELAAIKVDVSLEDELPKTAPKRMRAEADAIEAGDRAAEIACSMARFPALTAAGFQAKLRALNYYDPDALPKEVPEPADPNHVVGYSLRRDAERRNLGASVLSEAAALSPSLPGLSSLTAMQLCALYDRLVLAADFWNDAMHGHWANDPNGVGTGLRWPNAAGTFAEAEYARAGRIRDRVAKELADCPEPKDQSEADERLATLIRHELLCNGDLRDAPALLAAIVGRWGAAA